MAKNKVEITVSLREIVESFAALQVLANMPLPARKSFTLVRLIKGTINPELDAFSDTRQKVLAEYDDLTEDGTLPSDLDEQGEFLARIDELLDETEVELKFKPLRVVDIEDGSISAAHLLALYYLFEE